MLYIKEINNHRIGDSTPFEDVARSLGWTITRKDDEVEKALDGSLWEKGYAPEKPEPSYIESRQSAYPSIVDQLDMLYWDKVNGTNEWQETIADIKAKFPKPAKED